MGAGEGGGCDGFEQGKAQEDAVRVIAAKAEPVEPNSGPSQPPPILPNDYTAPHQDIGEAPRLADYHSQEHGNWSNEGRSTGEDSAPQQMDYALGGGFSGLGGRRRTPRQQEQNKHVSSMVNYTSRSLL